MTEPSPSDQNIYFISDRLSYTIRGEVVLDEPIDGAILQRAADTAFVRYPYFSVRPVLSGKEYQVIPNALPHKVIHGSGRITLGSPEVNGHLVVISYFKNKIFFHVSHCITDGAGRMPLTKSVLYYYLKEKYGKDLDPEGIYLAESDIFPDEDCEPGEGNPSPAICGRNVIAPPPAYQKIGNAYKLTSSGLITDDIQTEYRFQVDEAEFMKVCKAHGASPNSLTSVLLARSAWLLDPHISQNVVVNLCINMRKALGNPHCRRLMLACIPLSYDVSCPAAKTKAAGFCNGADIPIESDNPGAANASVNAGIPGICDDLDAANAATRASIVQQSQADNIRYLYQRSVIMADKVRKIKNLALKKKIMHTGIYGEEGFLSSTFIVSYVGKGNLGSLTPYVKAMYTTVDSIPAGGIIVEITCVGGFFNFSFLQDFSTDLYVQSFIRQLENLGASATEFTSLPLPSPLMQLPE